MTLKEILFGGGSALFVLLTLLQLAPHQNQSVVCNSKGFRARYQQRGLGEGRKARKRAAVRSVWHGRGKGRQLSGAHSTLRR